MSALKRRIFSHSIATTDNFRSNNKSLLIVTKSKRICGLLHDASRSYHTVFTMVYFNYSSPTFVVGWILEKSQFRILCEFWYTNFCSWYNIVLFLGDTWNTWMVKCYVTPALYTCISRRAGSFSINKYRNFNQHFLGTDMRFF